MANTYEPLAEEFDAEAIPVKRRGRRSKKGAAAGGAGRTVGIVVLVVLLVAIVVLAIALPIVFTRRTQQDAANAAAAGRAATSGTSGTSGAAGTPAGTPVLGSNPVDPGDVASQGSLGQGLLAPVGPNLNTGNDVFCYKSASTGEILPGAFRKTGVKSRDENDIERVEVRSCGSGSIMSLLESQLVVCSVPCFTPVWLAVKNGILVRPIWEEPIVCRGDQVYENRGLTGGSGSRYTFYWRFAGFVEEQLISQCDGDSAWWVPNVELSYCNVDQKVKCETANLNRAKPKGTPLLVQGVPAGTSQQARAVCVKEADASSGTMVRKAYWATGASSSSFVLSRFRFLDQIEVVPCNNRTAPSQFVPVDDIRFCKGTMKDDCEAAPAATTTLSAVPATTSSPVRSA